MSSVSQERTLKDCCTEAVVEKQEQIAKKIDFAAQKYAGGSWAADLRELAADIREVKP